MTESERYNRVVSYIREKAKEILPEGSSVTLFGSRARGDARPDSDWDIHILIPGPEKLPCSLIGEYSYEFYDAGWDIGEEINVVIHSYDGWKKRWFFPLYKNIMEEGIRL